MQRTLHRLGYASGSFSTADQREESKPLAKSVSIQLPDSVLEAADEEVPAAVFAISKSDDADEENNNMDADPTGGI